MPEKALKMTKNQRFLLAFPASHFNYPAENKGKFRRTLV
jgi:hypothetical protein